MSNWKTIDSAPKDGTHILGRHIPMGIRVTIMTNPPVVAHWFDDPDDPGFYMSSGIVQDSYNDKPLVLTHWTEIPC